MNRKLVQLIRGIVMLLALAGSGNAFSVQPGDPQQSGMPWGYLSPQEMDLLRSHRNQWNSYSPAQQHKLREGVQRYLSLTPAERDRVIRKHEEFRRMPAPQRKKLRDSYQRSHD